MAERGYDKFTDRAKQLLAGVSEAARPPSANLIQPLHFALGMTSNPDGITTKILTKLGVEVNVFRSTAEAILLEQSVSLDPSKVGLTTGSKRIIELAVDEVRRFKHPYIDEGHLLLGMMREAEEFGGTGLLTILDKFGINPKQVRSEVTAEFGQNPPERPVLKYVQVLKAWDNFFTDRNIPEEKKADYLAAIEEILSDARQPDK